MLSINRFEDYLMNGDVRYKAELSHRGLNEHRVLSDKDEDILENKITLLTTKWNNKWEVHQEKERNRRFLSDSKEEAIYRTEEAQSKQQQLQDILHHTLDIDDTVDWDSLKSNERFKEKKPQAPQKETLAPPFPQATQYVPTYDFWDKVLSKRKAKKDATARALFDKDYKEWERKMELLEKKYNHRYQEYELHLKEWEINKEDFYHKRKIKNSKIDLLKESYLALDGDSIEEYCDLVLSKSEYPSEFPQSFELAYTPDNKSIIVEYWLPSPDNLPTLKEVKFIASRKEIKEVHISDTQKNKLYDSVIYQIALRTIHELFEADAAQALDMITFNGWVNFINKATGKKENSCIISLQVSKEEFLDIDLRLVDPKVCFKALKGIGSSKLHGITAVKPILHIEKSDARFTDHYDVADDLDESVNLAMMHWEDFEHLIRELFEKEFKSSGGEVKVTRASKDGGVDAVAFDPDPLRGGKIVIQAKRYSNTVGVSAVRDLYGTVMNEGANKGILVTTSNFGSDAYNFAKDKPITLLSGANLLHLLERHGHKAKIDLKEAKENLKK